MKSNLLLVGGTGFIGRHLSCSLYENGVRFSILSRDPDEEFVEQYVPGVKVHRLEAFEHEFSRLIKSYSHVVYLASETSSAAMPENIVQSIGLRYINHLQFFESAYRANPDIKIVFVSSGGTVYGEGGHQPLLETAALAPLSPYGYSKMVVENGLQFLSRIFHTQYAIIRPANPVGKWQTSSVQGLIAHAIRHHREQRPLMVYGTGENVRDYFDADELADAISSITFDEKHPNEIWNVGSGQGYTINQVLNALAQELGERVKVDYLPGRETDVLYNVLDVEKIERLLGWKSQLELPQIIRNMLRSYDV